MVYHNETEEKTRIHNFLKKGKVEHWEAFIKLRIRKQRKTKEITIYVAACRHYRQELF